MEEALSNLALVLGITIPGVLLSTLLLSSIAYLALKRVSRKHLNRVSFRVLIYALISNLLFMILVFVDMAEIPHACGPVSFLRLFCISFSACMSFCIVLNLQLVLVHGINGNSMEKYYLIISILVCLACHIPAQIAGVYGWSNASGECWIRNPYRKDELAWLIGTQTFWLLSMASAEVISFLTITIFMVRQEIRLRRLKNGLHTTSASTNSLLVVRQAPIVKYRSTILRVGLYPLFSCICSAMSTLVNVFAIYTRSGFHPSPQILSLGVVMFLLRPLLYVLLAATDPGYLRAFQALCAHQRALSAAPTSQDSSAPIQARTHPRRFSEANRALIFVALGRGSAKTGRPSTATESSTDSPTHPKDEERAVVNNRMVEEVDSSVANQL